MNTSHISTRKLSAIMFADMVGYTLLMQEDETKAKFYRDRQRKVLEAALELHQGKVLQFYGDGTLCVFDSSLEAVNCAIKIQSELQKSPRVPLRIGIHIGDVVHDKEGVYGDGVNVASRIESMSVEGAVLISSRVHEDIKNHPSILHQSLGTFKLKNVAEPMEVYAIGNAPLVLPKASDVMGKATKVNKSIAVLPFVNMSADPENEYFSDGITEDILNALTKVEGLMVTARTSSFAFKGKQEDVRSIAEQLNVDHILEGSVRKSGNKVRITAQLIAAADGYHLWSENFDRKLDDIFEVQDEISITIARQLKEKLKVRQDPTDKGSSPTIDIENYNLYLRGNYYWNKWSPDNIKKAIDYYEKAIKKDPDFVLALSSLSGCYVYLGLTGYLPPNKAYPKAKEAAEKALQINSAHDKSHLTMAMFKFIYEQDYAAAEKHFKTALKLNVNNSMGHQYYALFLSTMGKTKAALKSIELAHQLDPLSLAIMGTLGNAYLIARMYDKAGEVFHNVIDMEPTFRTAFEGLGWVNVMKGQLDKALVYFKTFQELTGSKLKGVSGLGYVYGKLGQMEEAQKCIESLKERNKVEPEVNLDIDYAVVYAGMGDWESCFAYVQQAIDNKMGFIFIVIHPMWDEVRKDPRFLKILNTFKEVRKY